MSLPPVSETSTIHLGCISLHAYGGSSRGIVLDCTSSVIYQLSLCVSYHSESCIASCNACLYHARTHTNERDIPPLLRALHQPLLHRFVPKRASCSDNSVPLHADPTVYEGGWGYGRWRRSLLSFILVVGACLAAPWPLPIWRFSSLLLVLHMFIHHRALVYIQYWRHVKETNMTIGHTVMRSPSTRHSCELSYSFAQRDEP